MLFLISWFIVGLICALIIISIRFKMNNEIIVGDLAVFFFLCIIGYTSIFFLGLFFLSRYEKVLVYKGKNKPNYEKPQVQPPSKPKRNKKIVLLKEEK